MNIVEEITKIRERLAGLETNTGTILKLLKDDRDCRQRIEDRMRKTEGNISWLWGVLAIIGPLALVAFGAWVEKVF